MVAREVIASKPLNARLVASDDIADLMLTGIA
jgi:hypothetical protein